MIGLIVVLLVPVILAVVASYFSEADPLTKRYSVKLRKKQNIRTSGYISLNI